MAELLRQASITFGRRRKRDNYLPIRAHCPDCRALIYSAAFGNGQGERWCRVEIREVMAKHKCQEQPHAD